MAITFDQYSTTALMRVARAVTPVEDLNRWVFTAFERKWRMDGNGWVAYDITGNRLLDGRDGGAYVNGPDMREYVIEQLEAYRINGSHPMMEAH